MEFLNKPDKATISFVERPTALKLEMRRLRLEVGVGMLLLAAPWLAVLASLLPSFTSQLGPPSYIQQFCLLPYNFQRRFT